MKKFLFLGVGFLSLGTVFVLQADARQSCYSTTGSSRLSCASTTRSCSTCATRCYTRCIGTSRVYRRVRQVSTTNCSYSYCNNYSYRNYSTNYRVQRSTVNYSSRVNTTYYPRRVSNYRYVVPTTNCISHATCSTRVPVVRLVRPVTTYTNSYYYPYYNNSAVNKTVIVNVN